jgi:hypothetical protein
MPKRPLNWLFIASLVLGLGALVVWFAGGINPALIVAAGAVAAYRLSKRRPSEERD